MCVNTGTFFPWIQGINSIFDTSYEENYPNCNPKKAFRYFPFIQIEKPIVINKLHVDSLLDIAVNKFFTIYQQPASRHFIDLFCILQSSGIEWSDLSKLARIKFDSVIDPLQLGSQLITAKNIGQLPRMLIPVKESAWRSFFLEKAKNLKEKIGN